MEIKLYLIRIRFDTFSFKKITKAVKVNWLDKLSHIGGTAGLFNGFCFISIFEFLVLGVYMFIKHCFCFGEKDNESNSVNVLELQSNETENPETNDNIEEKLDAMNQTFEDLQRKLIVTRCKLEEDNQKLKSMEGERMVRNYRMETIKKELEREKFNEHM